MSNREMSTALLADGPPVAPELLPEAIAYLILIIIPTTHLSYVALRDKPFSLFPESLGLKQIYV